MLRKSQPNFQHYVKKTEAETKKRVSYKKTVYPKHPIKFEICDVIALALREDPYLNIYFEL